MGIWDYDNECFCRKDSYKKPIRETKNEFYVEECEVFQIVKL